VEGRLRKAGGDSTLLLLLVFVHDAPSQVNRTNTSSTIFDL
jgi:hypothetical protein